MDLISDNFWSKCEGVNGASFFEATFLCLWAGTLNIKYQLILMCSCSLPL
jgi:hypothetical protein